MKVICMSSNNPDVNLCVVMAQNGYMMIRHDGSTHFGVHDNVQRLIRERKPFPACAANRYLRDKKGTSLRGEMARHKHARW